MNIKVDAKCPETNSTLILYLYGEADNPKAFEAHLASCSECSKTFAEYAGTLEEYRALPMESMKTTVVRKVVADSKKRGVWSALNEFIGSLQMARPIMGYALAALLVVAVVVSIKLEFNYQRDVIEEKIEQPLGRIETMLGEMSAYNFQNEAASSTENTNDVFSNFDEMTAELTDIQDNLYDF